MLVRSKTISSTSILYLTSKLHDKLQVIYAVKNTVSLAPDPLLTAEQQRWRKTAVQNLHIQQAKVKNRIKSLLLCHSMKELSLFMKSGFNFNNDRVTMHMLPSRLMLYVLTCSNSHGTSSRHLVHHRIAIWSCIQSVILLEHADTGIKHCTCAYSSSRKPKLGA